MPNSQDYLPSCDFDTPSGATAGTSGSEPEPAPAPTKTLKHRLDTDKVFKKKLTRMATTPPEVRPVSPEPHTIETEQTVEVRQVTPAEDEGGKIVTEEEFHPKNQPAPKKKRIMTEKQLEALTRGRATSLAKRQANKKAKAQMNQPQVTSPREPEPEPKGPLTVHMDELPQEIPRHRVATQPDSRETHPLNPTHKENPATGTQYKIAREKPLNKDDIMSMMTGAISEYDNVRKQRKAEKKAQTQKVVHDSRISQQLNRVMNPGDPEYFNECFTFS